MSVIDVRQTRLFIGGEFVDPIENGAFVTLDPARGSVLAEVSEAGSGDVARATAAARTALEGPWGSMSLADRGRLLRRLAVAIDENRDYLAELESRDAGKPIRDCGPQVDALREWFEWFADIAGKVRSHVVPSDAGLFNYTLREPVGVVACITAWNYPLVLYGIKLAPALAMGNTVILKPAEQTPLTALALAEIAADAGMPEGVLNVVPGGPATGVALVEDPGVQMITFTGSTVVGKDIARGATNTLKRVSLELGGKSPAMIFADADLDSALPAALFSFCVNQGQLCTAGTRLLVDRQVHEEVVSRLTSLAAGLRVGDPLDADTQLGAIITADQVERIEGYVAEARETARLCTGGSRVEVPGCEDGQFFAPTIFDEVDPDARIAREEIFGPVLSVIPFDDEAAAIRMANDVTYGLSASIWTRDIGRAHRVSHAVDAGMIWVNTTNVLSPASPMSGHKQSGLGVEGGFEQCESFTRLKTVMTNFGGAPPQL